MIVISANSVQSKKNWHISYEKDVNQRYNPLAGRMS